ncbi:MAG: TetR-like C-terminal domain-containing protein [Mycobacterium sp.]
MVVVAVPDTGSLREDLLELARRSAAIQTSPAGEAVVRAVAGEAPGNPAIAAAAKRFWAERLELDARTADSPVIESLLSALYFRLLVTGEPLDDGFIESIADLGYAACRAPRPPS